MHGAAVPVSDNIRYIIKNDNANGGRPYIDYLCKGLVAALGGPKSGISSVEANPPTRQASPLARSSILSNRLRIGHVAPEGIENHGQYYSSLLTELINCYFKYGGKI